MLLAALLDAGADQEAVTAALRRLSDAAGEPVALRCDNVGGTGCAPAGHRRRGAEYRASPGPEQVLAPGTGGPAAPSRRPEFAATAFGLLADAESQGTRRSGRAGRVPRGRRAGLAGRRHRLRGRAALARTAGSGRSSHRQCVGLGSGTVGTAHGACQCRSRRSSSCSPSQEHPPARVRARASLHADRCCVAGRTGGWLGGDAGLWWCGGRVRRGQPGSGRSSERAPGISASQAGRRRPGCASLRLVEATVDDLDPRLWPDALEACERRALDCWLTPALMRTGRPAQVVSALTGLTPSRQWCARC